MKVVIIGREHKFVERTK